MFYNRYQYKLVFLGQLLWHLEQFALGFLKVVHTADDSVSQRINLALIVVQIQNKSDLDRFTEGSFEFDASASAALITEGANASADYSNGAAVFTFSKGGLMYEASIGGQKFSYESY